MKLKILLPTEVFLEAEINKITAEALNMHFTLLPRHIDFVTALVSGILFFQKTDHHLEFIAIDEGILVKCGQEILVSVNHAVKGEHLETLQETVNKQFKLLDEQEKNKGIWYGLGMSGLVGWAVTVPTLLGLALGVWIDQHLISSYSWTLMGLIIGITLGCLNAWYWIEKERNKP
jgi:F-type H+-transporting ATPase subunit epsilon